MTTDSPPSPSPAPVTLLDRYRLMVRMRAFEAACAEGITSGELRGELHLATGQEGVAAALAATVRAGDWLVSTHRSHLHAIAKGVPIRPLLAEVYEKVGGLSRGRGGHLHLFDLDHRFSSTGIVGANLPVALGHAYAARLDGTSDVAVAITGDGGTNAGPFHETLNMAAIWTLPLVVLVENNGYAISVPARDVTAGAGIAERAAAYGIRGERADGTDVDIATEAVGRALDHARSGAGPVLLELTCHRFRGHYEGDTDHYRSRAEREAMAAKGDPIARAAGRLEATGVDAATLATIEAEASDEMARHLAAVRADPDPDPAEAAAGVFAGRP